MTDSEEKEIEQIKKELNIRGESKDLELLRMFKRMSKTYAETERILNQPDINNIFKRIKKRIYKK